MIRYTLFVLAVVGSAATALANINPHNTEAQISRNVTVIHMTEIWPTEGKLEVEKCAVEDCSDTPQG